MEKPGAPVRYEDFRTGLSFKQVYAMIWDRPYKRRNGVLGAWRQIKLAMFEEYLRQHDELTRAWWREQSAKIFGRQRRARLVNSGVDIRTKAA